MACCRLSCTGRIVVPEALRREWTAAACSAGHSCWIARGVGKVVVMNYRDPVPEPVRLSRLSAAQGQRPQPPR